MIALLLVDHYDELPNYRAIYGKPRELKQKVIAQWKPWGFESIVEFPDDPHELPKDISNSAYDAGPPVKRDFVGINAVAESVPLRKNSKLLESKTPATTLPPTLGTKSNASPIRSMSIQ